MSKVREIFQAMPSRYVPSPGMATKTYYFSVGPEKWTVSMHADRCEAVPGKTVDNADVVLKCDPALFEKMVLHGKMPGPIDIARGKIKTNDPAALQALKDRFRM
ncbi:MAG: hypothetical protein H6742_16415 [Alphaproteobacteria bacterium]|nr:hypothetical protein [Alphaproteobacteria bacterium]